ncbi:MAG: TniB family NTP-binding protein [Burkholderiaceae bacterium]|nr:TniB family NTP-binding protein [Burkholderiaceae bacterium]
MHEHIFPSPPEKDHWSGKSIPEREDWLSTFYVSHPAIQVPFDHIRVKIDACDRTGKSDAVLILGGSGSGKTAFASLVLQYGESRFKREDPERTICPVLKLNVPDPCTPFEFAVAILEGLGDPKPRGRRNRADTFKAAELLLRTCCVRLVVIDNTQDIPARRAARGIELVGARLREFMDHSSALWLFLGTDDALKVVQSDPQLVRRICYRARIPYFGINDTKSQRAFRVLLGKIDFWLPLSEPSCLSVPGTAGLIHIATEGIFDRLVKLVDRGWIEAVLDNRESMTIQDLEKAFLFLHGPAVEASNPFRSDFVARRLRGPGEPFEILRGQE